MISSFSISVSRCVFFHAEICRDSDDGGCEEGEGRKAHDKNDLAELQELAQIVYADDQIRHCPHGRPVMFVMKRQELEKQFKRV